MTDNNDVSRTELETAPMEVWGGAEYTCNRVGERYIDQMNLSGHGAQDLELFAELGISAIRCGVLWERHDLNPSWQSPDAYLTAARRLNIRPIVGLLHHGSGPRHTNLLDPEFALKLASYAGEVAARYPWVDAYTPVNEPHTTARFACRYGLWYPHHRSKQSHLRALLNQVKAVVLSMRAIRNVRSDANLVQTEDIGRTWSTPQLAEISALLNERRWLTYDLLCGTVNRFHPLYSYLHQAGISDDEIFWFSENPCPPDIIGVNYYATSDRFLDHRLDLYPDNRRSAEGPFVDIEAVRVRPEGIQGFEGVLLETYARYQLPIAITEVHLGDRVEEQIRWAAEAWTEALRARDDGVSCRAVTFWALLGSYFWNSLVTAENGHYEPGVFEVLRGKPEPTALAELVRQCARGEGLHHPALEQPGWWQQPSRIHYDVDDELVA
jgi:beta-glucosidase/6-phospho-beta-glucosidase/beta-galactosidase